MTQYNDDLEDISALAGCSIITGMILFFMLLFWFIVAAVLVVLLLG